MRYEFECNNTACAQRFDVWLSMTVKGTKEEPPSRCPKCGFLARHVISGGAGFILRGFSGWAGKISKTNRERQKRSEELEVKQYERYGLDGGCKMVPNFGGQTMDSWKEVHKVASEEAKKSGKPVDPMHDHLLVREKLQSQITTKTQVTVKPTHPTKPTKVVSKAKPISIAP